MSEESKQFQQQTGGISLRDLKEILAEQARQNAEQMKTVIEELKKPTLLEQKQLDAEAKAILEKNQERKENAAGMLIKIENKRAVQRICSHKHRTGQSHCVYIMEKTGPGYILCQKEQCKIRPEPAPKNYNGDDIFDTALFNRLFQEMPSNEMFG
jgi:hypothetical protein